MSEQTQLLTVQRKHSWHAFIILRGQGSEVDIRRFGLGLGIGLQL